MGSGCWTIRARIFDPTALSAFLEFSTEPLVIRLVASGLHLFQATSLKPQGDSSAMLLRLGILHGFSR